MHGRGMVRVQHRSCCVELKSVNPCVELSKQAITAVECCKGPDDKWVFPGGGGGLVLVLVLGSWDR